MNLGSRSPNKQIAAGIALMALAIFGAAGTAGAADPYFGDAGSKNEACLSCHTNTTRVGAKNLIDQTKFEHTTHAKFGCKSCHDGITSSHPDGRSVAHTTTCRDCHDTTAAEYATSSHARNANCGGCHNPHRVVAADEVSGDDMNKMCNGCHKKQKIVASHSQWLPQAGIHIESIACITCHSKAENFVVSIYIVKRNPKGGGDKSEPAKYDELVSRGNQKNLESLIDRNNDNYISLDELRSFNRNPAYSDLYLKGMLTPVKPTHAFQTFDNRFNCTFCHSTGPEAMQTSYVSIPEPEGTFKQVAVEKGAVLDALHAIPGFYLMGSTRNSTLNKIGLVIIAGGLVMPVGHGFLRFLTRKNRK